MDTRLIGLLIKEGEIIRYYPSPEYLEAGKFKLDRRTLKEKGVDTYSEFYTKKLA